MDAPAEYTDPPVHGDRAGTAPCRLYGASRRPAAPRVASLCGYAPPSMASATPTIPAIAFVGLMGAGKSTIARRAGRALGLEVADIDELVEEPRLAVLPDPLDLRRAR